VFSNLLPADREMAAHIDKVRAPHRAKLEEKLAVSEGLLYRRGNFNGSWDQLILDAMLEVKGAQIGFSPGFRWGTTILPGQAITFEHLMDQTAITYPHSTLTEMSGEQIKTILEDVGDNLFNPDPYNQQGGDMVRVGGLEYACDPNAKIGSRIQDMRLEASRSKPPRPTRWPAGRRWPKAPRASRCGTWWRATCATRRPSPRASSTSRS
jgi:sulfur-oxidizing protein SoxB